MRRYLKSAVAKYYAFVADIVGLIHIQSGTLNSGQRYPNARSLPDGAESSWLCVERSVRATQPFGTNDAFGGTKYWGASAELQMPFWFLPKEVGLKGRLALMPARSMTIRARHRGSDGRSQCARLHSSTRNPVTAGTCTGLVFDNGNVVRSSVGVGLIWASPFGPLRFDYAVPLTKGPNDRVQQFKFGGGTSF
jgi:outer membrane protein insertion porin family